MEALNFNNRSSLIVLNITRPGKNEESGNEIPGIFSPIFQKKFEMKFLKTIFKVFVVNRESSYVKARPTH